LFDEGLFLVDVNLEDVRRERVALPLLRDERLELQARELGRIISERAGLASDSTAEPGSEPGLDVAAPRGRTAATARPAVAPEAPGEPIRLRARRR
jgi:hypothetical protein